MTEKTKAQIQSEVGTSFPDNISGAITPVVQRSFLTDLTDSTPFLLDTSFQLNGAAGFNINSASQVGIGVAPSPNMWLKVGNGTGGSLPDTQKVVLKGLVSADPSGNPPQALQINVNLPVASNVGGNPTIGVVSRIDNRGSSGGGSQVALWGDVFVRAPTDADVWGINAYVQIDEPTYTKTAVNELGIFNNSNNANAGGPLNIVSNGTKETQFLLLADGLANHAIMVQNNASGPKINAFYYGALAAGNVPTGTPQFVVNAAGQVGIGKGAVGTAWLSLAAATTGTAILNLPVGGPPTTPNDGDIWREDNTNTGLKIRINGVTKSITVA